MRFILKPCCTTQIAVILILSVCTSLAGLQAQSCTPIENFHTSFYNIHRAVYEWAPAQDAKSYLLDVDINGKPYKQYDVPGGANKFVVEFEPALQNYDHVEARIIKYCTGGGIVRSSADFIIITDGIVYINGEPQQGEPKTVERVSAVDDNLVPATHVCGLCDPEYFHLTSGFYGPFGIYTSTLATPIENLRFLKDDLCNCLDAAIAAGILNPHGGPGPNHGGTPFTCNILPYLVESPDCTPKREAKNEGRSDKAEPADDLPLEIIPNPASGWAQITYTLQQETNTVLVVYDLAGRPVNRLVDHARQTPGEYRLPLDVSALTPGFYFCRLEAGGLRQIRTLVVVH